MSRVVFINRFYFPEEPATAQLLGDLAENLAAHGYEVSVVTGHPRNSPARQSRNGVAINRVGPFAAGSNSLPARAATFVCFWAACAWHLLRTVRRGDVLVALTDPPLVGIVAVVIGRMRGADVIHWVQDIYPEVAELLTPRPAVRWLLAAVTPARNWAWRRSRACVTLGADMAAHLRSQGVPAGRIHLIPNWPPAGVGPADGNPLRLERGLTGKFVVAYSGNLGRVHQLDSVVPVAARLKERRAIVFAFTGGGARRKPLEALLTAAGANACFYPPQPRAGLSEGLAVGDVHWVTLKPGAERVVFPSKFSGILAAGKPVLFLGSPDCELAQIIRSEGVGFAFAPEACEEIAACIVQLAGDPESVAGMGRRALALAERHATLEHAVAFWTTLLGPPKAGLPVASGGERIIPSDVEP